MRKQKESRRAKDKSENFKATLEQLGLKNEDELKENEARNCI